jgi:hypothetical protein
MSSPHANSNPLLSHPHHKEGTLPDDGSPPLLLFLPRPKILLLQGDYNLVRRVVVFMIVTLYSLTLSPIYTVAWCQLLVGLVDECKKHAVYDVLQGSDTDKNNAWNKSVHGFFHPLYGTTRGFRCAGGDELVKEFQRVLCETHSPMASSSR